jgi:dipeptidase E
MAENDMRLLLLSNSQCEGMGYLEHAQGFLREFLARPPSEVLFIPYAAVTKRYDDYVAQVQSAFGALGINVRGVHADADPVEAVRKALVIVIGGGNTWKLLREVRSQRLLPEIRNRVAVGVPYIGWSAGSNLACPTIMTTNDMPICNPGGFEALGLVPFQVNPHYLHGNPPGFRGETREERITELCILQPRVWVAGLREGTGLRIESGSVRLVGDGRCRVFRHDEAPRELGASDNFDFLLESV